MMGEECMRDSIFSVAVFALCFFIVQSTSAVTKFSAVGVYDADEQGNAVDKSAAYDLEHSTGVGMSRALVLNVDDFSPLIPAAFTNRHGGVVNFDNGLIAAGKQTDSFAVLFDGKAVLFRSTDHVRTDYVSSSRTSISGPGKVPGGGFLAKSTVMGDACTMGGSYQLTLTEYGFEPDERVRVVAGTILGRSNSDKNGKWIMKVTLDNGDIVAASASLDVSSGNTSDDTFFGAFAPAGRYINGVSWISNSGEFSGLDDLAFITSTSDFSLPKIEVAAKPNPPTTNQPPPSKTRASGEGSSGNYSILFGTDLPYR
jgi:hypothetical protein